MTPINMYAVHPSKNYEIYLSIQKYIWYQKDVVIFSFFRNILMAHLWVTSVLWILCHYS